MSKFSFTALLLGGTLSLYAQVENKAVSKNFNFTGTTVNTFVVAPNFEIPVTETGNYLVIVEAEARVPTATSNGCLNSYWNDGYIFLYNRTKNVDYSPGVGSYKWYLVSSANGCTGGQTIPLSPTRSFIVSLQAGNVLTVRGRTNKVETLALNPWGFTGKVQLIRLN